MGIKSQSGLSLLEILVASAMLAVIGLGVTTLTTSQVKVNSGLSGDLEILGVKQRLAGLTRLYSACGCMFNTISWNPDSSDSMELTTIPSGCITGTNGKFLEVGQGISGENEGLKVDKIKLIKMKELVSSPTKIVQADIQVQLTNTSGGAGTATTHQVLLPGLKFELSSDSKIGKCTHVRSPAQVCTDLGGEMINSKCNVKVISQGGTQGMCDGTLVEPKQYCNSNYNWGGDKVGASPTWGTADHSAVPGYVIEPLTDGMAVERTFYGQAKHSLKPGSYMAEVVIKATCTSGTLLLTCSPVHCVTNSNNCPQSQEFLDAGTDGP